MKKTTTFLACAIIAWGCGPAFCGSFFDGADDEDYNIGTHRTAAHQRYLEAEASESDGAAPPVVDAQPSSGWKRPSDYNCTEHRAVSARRTLQTQAEQSLDSTPPPVIEPGEDYNIGYHRRVAIQRYLEAQAAKDADAAPPATEPNPSSRWTRPSDYDCTDHRARPAAEAQTTTRIYAMEEAPLSDVLYEALKSHTATMRIIREGNQIAAVIDFPAPQDALHNCKNLNYFFTEADENPACVDSNIIEAIEECTALKFYFKAVEASQNLSPDALGYELKSDEASGTRSIAVYVER
ncbi:MAG: hypothetical protein HY611_04075 [Elusimicrobia bacterium]|nr:hypothetical protein [Elusimicrobiota bacterium]